MWGIDPADAVFMQLSYLVRDDNATTAAKDPDIGSAALAQHIDHVLEEFGVAALIGADRDALGIFFDCRIDNFPHRPVVAEVNDFRTGCLKDAAHDVD